MSYDRLTGHVVADIEYRLKQIDDSGQLEEHGIIDYDLSLGSGTGLAQVNDVWYAERTFTATDTVDLSNLSLKRFGRSYTTSFLGVSGSGNVKGVKVDNLSGETLYLTIPFTNFSGQQKVPPSGSLVLSNRNGWTVSSLTSNVSVSGDTNASKSYNFGLLGCGLPAMISIDGVLNYESISSGIGIGSGDLYVEWLGSSIFSGEIPYEFLRANSSIDNILNLEFLLDLATSSGTGLSSGVLNYEWTTPSGFNTLLNVEWTGNAGSGRPTGTGCTDCGLELLINPTFQYGYTDPSSLQFYDPNTPNLNPRWTCNPVVAIPAWDQSGTYSTSSWQDPANIQFNLTTLGLLGYCPCTPGQLDGNSYNCPQQDQDSILLTTQDCYIRQTVNVNPSGHYQLKYFPRSNLQGIGGAVCYANIKNAAGGIIAQDIINNSFMSTYGGKWRYLSVYANGNTKLTVEFRCNTSGPPYYDNSGFSWSGDNVGGYNRRVSFYRTS